MLENLRLTGFGLISACAIAVPLLTVGPATAAQSVDGDACDIWAWSIDDDPKGLNVRSGPSTAHGVIAVLPPPKRKEGYVFRTEVEVKESQAGWFRITQAVVPDYLDEGGDQTVFEGEGWVSGGGLGLLLNRIKLYEAPSTEATVVAELLDGNVDGPDSFTVERLYACTGWWVEVEATLGERRHRGWASGTCSNQVTTCP
ncbi:SH3 domain-containing protein [Ciceribacter sp. L1K23]|uniref:SH3 domain-containing protein n=1 Tax=unclassified Ciceribacter TaxID=2628820 RepID=UPI001ABDF604|nr:MULTISPECIES: SH3 domain-containing protein [unclassified Ciceribacter]MBO3759065.1 SH3 domain-containing protein [Ciceribacter sp. L1K22]MBR0556788.1 SH3 domain-containing protein [Ciceribacter sp. L1K23]